MLEIKSFEFGSFGTNTYVVSSLPAGEGRGEASVLLIDPACSNEYERQLLKDYINSLSCGEGRGEVLILATHGHLDHLWGAAWATEQWHTPVLMHEADIPMAQAMQTQYNLFGIRATPQPFPIEPLNSQLSTFNSQLSILPTPGHTPGSVCFYWQEEKVLLSGDTLFRMGYGRTDLPGGDMGQMIDSLRRLFTLPDDTRVYPGHGDFTTIGAEKRS
jgi:glyoxylase-like metal-dependent hydrolase (beta-lactamase superfamily II)